MRFLRFTTLQLLLAAALCALVLGLATTSWQANDYAQVTAVTYSPSGKYLAAHYHTGGVRVWNVQAGQPQLTTEIRVTNPWTDKSGQQLIFVDEASLLDIECQWAQPPATHDAVVRTIDVETGRVQRPLSFKASSYSGIYAAAGDTLAVVNRLEGTVDCYSLRDPRDVQRIRTVGSSAYGVWLTPDGRLLVVYDQSGMIHVCDIASGRTVHSLPAKGVGTATISRDGQRLAHVVLPTSTLRTCVRLYRLPSNSLDRTVELDNLHPGWVSFNADGSKLVIAGPEEADIYDLNQDRIIGHVNLHEIPIDSWIVSPGRSKSGGNFSQFTFAPDGRTLVSFDGGDVLLWDTHSGQLHHRIAGQSRLPQILIFTLGFIGWSIAWGVVARGQRPVTTQHQLPLELRVVWGLMFIGGLIAVGFPVTLLVIQGPLLWPGIYYALGVGLVLIVGAAGRRTAELQRLPILQMFNLVACDWVNFVLGVLCHSLLRRQHVQSYLMQAQWPPHPPTTAPAPETCPPGSDHPSSVPS